MNKLTQLSIIIFLPIMLGIFAYVSYEYQSLKGISVLYQDQIGNSQHFISEEQVHGIVLQGKVLERLYTKDIDILSVKNRLEQHPLVEDAQVYMGLNGVLHIQIKEPNPVARVMVGKGFVYMDNNAREMPLSHSYAKRVVLLSGVRAGTPAWNEAFVIVSAIEQDAFLRENVTNVWYKDRNFHLKMREGDFVVTIGDNQQVQRKFNNLKAFYKKAQRDQFLNRYKEINLQYSNQVVCIK